MDRRLREVCRSRGGVGGIGGRQGGQDRVNGGPREEFV